MSQLFPTSEPNNSGLVFNKKFALSGFLTGLLSLGAVTIIEDFFQSLYSDLPIIFLIYYRYIAVFILGIIVYFLFIIREKEDKIKKSFRFWGFFILGLILGLIITVLLFFTFYPKCIGC